MFKKKINKQLILFYVLTLICHTSQADNATLVIYQKENSGQSFRIFINDRYYGILQPQSYASIPVCPEKNSIAISLPIPAAPLISISTDWLNQQDTLFFEAFQINNEVHLIAIENVEYAHSVIHTLRSFSGLSRVQKPLCLK